MAGAGAEALERARESLLEAALAHVPFDGWTAAALSAGAKDAGLDAATLVRAFPDGAIDLIGYWNARADRRMLTALAGQDLAKLKVRQRVALAVRLRLEEAAPHREAVRRGLAFLALPRNAAVGLRALWRTADAIWHAAGDSATDYNYYTKRALLAAVYLPTVTFWLDDRSEGASATWAFLDRRIAGITRVPRALAGLQKAAESLPNPFRFFRSRPARGR